MDLVLEKGVFFRWKWKICKKIKKIFSISKIFFGRCVRARNEWNFACRNFAKLSLTLWRNLFNQRLSKNGRKITAVFIYPWKNIGFWAFLCVSSKRMSIFEKIPFTLWKRWFFTHFWNFYPQINPKWRLRRFMMFLSVKCLENGNVYHLVWGEESEQFCPKNAV